MSQDHWQAFRHYEERQRQERAKREQALADLQQATKKQEVEQQIARERERLAAEQRQAELRQIAEQETTERERLKQEIRNDVLTHIAHSLQRANQQAREAQQIARLKRQAEKSVSKTSPIEDMFFEAWCKAYPVITLERQYKIGRYRVDFAHVETKTIIELDGYEYHHRKKDRNKDYTRQHAIEDEGWLFVRFTGSQIFSDVEACIRRTYKRIISRQGVVG